MWVIGWLFRQIMEAVLFHVLLLPFLNQNHTLWTNQSSGSLITMPRRISLHSSSLVSNAASLPSYWQYLSPVKATDSDSNIMSHIMRDSGYCCVPQTRTIAHPTMSEQCWVLMVKTKEFIGCFKSDFSQNCAKLFIRLLLSLLHHVLELI